MLEYSIFRILLPGVWALGLGFGIFCYWVGEVELFCVGSEASGLETNHPSFVGANYMRSDRLRSA